MSPLLIGLGIAVVLALVVRADATNRIWPPGKNGPNWMWTVLLLGLLAVPFYIAARRKSQPKKLALRAGKKR